MRTPRFLLMVLLTIIGSTSFAQFQPHSHEGFETGQLDRGVAFLHNSTRMNTKVMNLRTLGAPDIASGPAAAECGQFGLLFQTTSSERFLGVVAPVSLDRRLLGAKGRALFQADFYLKNMDNVNHTVALGAFANYPTGGAADKAGAWTLYRFGVIQQNKTYFSYTNAAPQPRIYLHQALGEIIPDNQGWHRFQMVFEGQDKIYCYVDGVMTTFSPIFESNYRVLHPGIIVTAPEDDPVVAVADNLSILWTPDPNTPMPQSPWISPETIANAQARAITWNLDTSEAWQEAQQEQRPILVMFSNPVSVAYQQVINRIFREEQEARDMLKNYVLLRVDTNEQQGADLARRFRVLRAPTFMVIGPDGQERTRFVVEKDSAWTHIRPELMKGF